MNGRIFIHACFPCSEVFYFRFCEYGHLRGVVYGRHRHTYLSFSDKGQVPIFLGSSFAFIAPIVRATELYGLLGTLSGLAAVGAVFGIMSA